MRKGQSGLFMADVVGIFLVVLVLGGFYFFIVVQDIFHGTEKQTLAAVSQQNAELNLLSFLRSPVELKGVNITTSELIALWTTDKTLEEPLRKQVIAIFSKVYGGCYEFVIYDRDSHVLFSEKIKKTAGKVSPSFVKMPLPNHEEITISLTPAYYSFDKNSYALCGVA